jgi:hypothetical protein
MRTMCARAFWRRTQCAWRFGGSKKRSFFSKTAAAIYLNRFLYQD